MKKLLPLFVLLACQLGFAQSLEGDWKGDLNVQGTTLPTIFHIEKADGTYTATMDSPKQNAFGIPLDEVAFSDNQLSIIHTAAQLNYEAKLVDDTHLEGTFKQRGFRGHLLNDEDLLMRRHILNLMCHLQTELLEEDLLMELPEILIRLEEMKKDDLIEIKENSLKITEKGRPFVRNICMAFDLRLQRKKPETRLFSMTV